MTDAPAGLSIRLRILVACLLLTILTMALGVFTVRGQVQLGSLALRMYDQAFMSVDFFRSAQLDFTALQAVAGRPGGGAQVRREASRVIDDLEIAIERATSNQARTIAAELKRLFLLLSAPEMDDEEGRAVLARAARLFERGSEQFAQDGFAFRQQAEQVAVDSQLASRIAIGASLIAGLLITVNLSRSIVPPLRRVTAIATEIARGNLGNEIQPRGTSEMVTLLAALRAMQDALVERRSAAEQIEHLALHDVLTGLSNRLHFAEALGAAAAGGVPFALLLIDLDRFKPVNDKFGHAVGDVLLQAVARRFTRCIGEADFLARLGGDEFAVLQIGGQAPEAERLARKLVDAIMRPFELENRQVWIGCSVGIRCCDGVMASDTLLRDADTALYTAKAGGRSSFRFFEDRPTALRRQSVTVAGADGMPLAPGPHEERPWPTPGGAGRFAAARRLEPPPRGEAGPATRPAPADPVRLGAD